MAYMSPPHTMRRRTALVVFTAALALTMAQTAGAAQRVVLGEYFTNQY